MVDHDEVLHSIKCIQGEEAVTRTNSILHSPAFYVEVFRSYVKDAADCNDLSQEVAKVIKVDRSFEKNLLKRESSEANGSVLFQLYLFKVLQLQLQLAMSADDILFCAHFCERITSCTCHATMLPFFKTNNSYLPQTVTNSP